MLACLLNPLCLLHASPRLSLVLQAATKSLSLALNTLGEMERNRPTVVHDCTNLPSLLASQLPAT